MTCFKRTFEHVALLMRRESYAVGWRSPLAVAIGYGRWTIANLLIAKGADVNISNDRYVRWTPLHLAARAGKDRKSVV